MAPPLVRPFEEFCRRAAPSASRPRRSKLHGPLPQVELRPKPNVDGPAVVPQGPLAELGDALRALRPKFFAFVLSFLVIGQYWMAHHRIFRHVRRYDLGLLWLNLLYLLGIAFLPDGAAATIFTHAWWVSSTVSASSCRVRWARSCGSTPNDGRSWTRCRPRPDGRSRPATPAVFLLGAGAALIDIYLAVFCWTVPLPLRDFSSPYGSSDQVAGTIAVERP
ncbi:MAG: TMEM175 family protein [Actinomycetota bacterium]